MRVEDGLDVPEAVSVKVAICGTVASANWQGKCGKLSCSKPA
jgi:hypothetical protein